MKKLVAAAFLTSSLVIGKAQLVHNAITFSAIALPNDTLRLVNDSTIMVLQPVQNVVKESNVEYPAILKNLPPEAIEYVQQFASNRKNYALRLFQVGKPYFKKVTKIFNKQSIPQEMRMLIGMESYFKKDVKSPVGAFGYWQFMDYVAVEYGLNIADSAKDERMDFNKSTKAAGKYMRDRYRNLNNWLLVVASYNCGVGNVWKAQRASGKTNVWDIIKYLPMETQKYVKNFVALNLLQYNYKNFAKGNLIFEDVVKEETIAVVKKVEKNADLTSTAKPSLAILKK
jgi:membrane-bound lytic murein transglycosylase D